MTPVAKSKAGTQDEVAASKFDATTSKEVSLKDTAASKDCNAQPTITNKIRKKKEEPTVKSKEKIGSADRYVAGIDNNRLSIEHLERELITRVEFFEAKYTNLDMQFTNKIANVEQQRLLMVEKLEAAKVENGLAMKKIQKMNDIISEHKTEIDILKRNAEKNNNVNVPEHECSVDKQEAYEEEIKSLKDTINNQRVEIEKLKLTIEHNKDMVQYNDEISAEIRDANVQWNTTFQGFSSKQDAKNDFFTSDIKKISTMISKKANQSDVDGMKHQINKELIPILSLSHQNTGRSADGCPNLPKQAVDTGKVISDKSISNRKSTDTSIEALVEVPQEWGSTVKDEMEDERTAPRRDENSPEQSDNDEIGDIDDEVILLMDSNEKFINPKRFWPSMSTVIFRVSKAAKLRAFINSHRFKNPKHIIIGTGTNDTDVRPANEIFADLRQGANILKNQYKEANIYISQVPPRKEQKREVIANLNKLIEEGANESINVIVQNELRIDHLHDERHIKRKDIGMYVKPMKDKIREILGIELDDNQHRSQSPPIGRRGAQIGRGGASRGGASSGRNGYNRGTRRESDSGTDNTDQVTGTDSSKFDSDNRGIAWKQMMKAMQDSNNMMMNNMMAMKTFLDNS